MLEWYYVPDIDMEDFYWPILLMEEFLKDDIRGYRVTCLMTAMEVETVIQVRGGANTHFDILCVCVCARCYFCLFYTWQLSRELRRIGRLHQLGVNICLHRVFKLRLFHRRGLIYSNCWCVQPSYVINMLFRETLWAETHVYSVHTITHTLTITCNAAEVRCTMVPKINSQDCVTNKKMCIYMLCVLWCQGMAWKISDFL
jgi:hypothetical protein